MIKKYGLCSGAGRVSGWYQGYHLCDGTAHYEASWGRGHFYTGKWGCRITARCDGVKCKGGTPIDPDTLPDACQQELKLYEQ